MPLLLKGPCNVTPAATKAKTEGPMVVGSAWSRGMDARRPGEVVIFAF